MYKRLRTQGRQSLWPQGAHSPAVRTGTARRKCKLRSRLRSNVARVMMVEKKLTGFYEREGLAGAATGKEHFHVQGPVQENKNEQLLMFT